MYSFLRVSLYGKDNSKINQAKKPGKKFIKTKINQEFFSLWKLEYLKIVDQKWFWGQRSASLLGAHTLLMFKVNPYLYIIHQKIGNKSLQRLCHFSISFLAFNCVAFFLAIHPKNIFKENKMSTFFCGQIFQRWWSKNLPWGWPWVDNGLTMSWPWVDNEPF